MILELKVDKKLWKQINHLYPQGPSHSLYQKIEIVRNSKKKSLTSYYIENSYFSHIKIIYSEISSFFNVLFFHKNISERKEYFYGNKEKTLFSIVRYPHIGEFINIIGNSNQIKEVASLLKINHEESLISKSPLFFQKIIVQEKMWNCGNTFLDQIICNHKILQKIYNILHTKTNGLFLFVDLETNSQCNRKCVYCPNHRFSRPKIDMPIKMFKKIVMELGKINYDGFIHYTFYNEPLLDQRLEKFLKLAKKHCPNAKNHINSNGDLLNYERYVKLIDAGADYFFITAHDGRLTDKLKDRIKQAKQYRNAIDYALPKEIHLHNRAGLVEIKTNKPWKTRPCYRPSFAIEILANGNVVPCCNDYFEQLVVGNVRNNSILSIWRNQKFKQFRKDLSLGHRYKYKLCANCNA